MKQPPIATDNCPGGVGRTARNEYCHATLLSTLQVQTKYLVQPTTPTFQDVECFCSSFFLAKYFWVHVNNKVASHIVNIGASRDNRLQDCLHEMAMQQLKISLF